MDKTFIIFICPQLSVIKNKQTNNKSTTSLFSNTFVCRWSPKRGRRQLEGEVHFSAGVCGSHVCTPTCTHPLSDHIWQETAAALTSRASFMSTVGRKRRSAEIFSGKANPPFIRNQWESVSLTPVRNQVLSQHVCSHVCQPQKQAKGTEIMLKYKRKWYF